MAIVERRTKKHSKGLCASGKTNSERDLSGLKFKTKQLKLTQRRIDLLFKHKTKADTSESDEETEIYLKTDSEVKTSASTLLTNPNVLTSKLASSNNTKSSDPLKGLSSLRKNQTNYATGVSVGCESTGSSNNTEVFDLSKELLSQHKHQSSCVTGMNASCEPVSDFPQGIFDTSAEQTDSETACSINKEVLGYTNVQLSLKATGSDLDSPNTSPSVSISTEKMGDQENADAPVTLAQMKTLLNDMTETWKVQVKKELTDLFIAG